MRLLVAPLANTDQPFLSVDLNNRASTWSKLDTEVNVPLLATLLFDWLEHLKSPILDRDGITYVVIHCDNIEAALNK